tara:strand:+ start:325 stop:741 length:417 start_codon:yes stop_codon:yes gene_type:complete
MGVVGAALRGFGKALGKKGDGKRITRVPIAKRLTDRRKNTEKLFKVRQDAGASPMKSMSKAVSDTSAANTKYDKAVSASDKKFKSQKRKVIGGASAAVVGAVGAHGAAKKKFPKYKKVMESDVVIKDGKLGLRPKKKK